MKLHGAFGEAAKAIYEDAWWVSKLKLLRGVRENLTGEPPVAMHYHDGEVPLASHGQLASVRLDNKISTLTSTLQCM